jgi:G3E family GTPase
MTDVVDHRPMWTDLGLDLEAHDMLLAALPQMYQAAFLTQEGRPEGMGYLDYVMSEIHGLRVKELVDHKAAGGTVIGTFCVYLEGAASWQGYAAWLQALRALRGEDLLRVKGLVEIEDTGRPYVVQGVQHVFSPPLRLDAWPSEDHRSRLVFITRDLDRAALEETLRLLRDPASVV